MTLNIGTTVRITSDRSLLGEAAYSYIGKVGTIDSASGDSYVVVFDEAVESAHRTDPDLKAPWMWSEAALDVVNHPGDFVPADSPDATPAHSFKVGDVVVSSSTPGVPVHARCTVMALDGLDNLVVEDHGSNMEDYYIFEGQVTVPASGFKIADTMGCMNMGYKDTPDPLATSIAIDTETKLLPPDSQGIKHPAFEVGDRARLRSHSRISEPSSIDDILTAMTKQSIGDEGVVTRVSTSGKNIDVTFDAGTSIHGWHVAWYDFVEAAQVDEVDYPTQIDSLERDLEAARSEASDLARDLSASQAEVDRAYVRVEEVNVERTTLTQAASDERRRLCAEIDEANAEIGRLQKIVNYSGAMLDASQQMRLEGFIEGLDA